MVVCISEFASGSTAGIKAGMMESRLELRSAPMVDSSKKRYHPSLVIITEEGEFHILRWACCFCARPSEERIS